MDWEEMDEKKMDALQETMDPDRNPNQKAFSQK